MIFLAQCALLSVGVVLLVIGLDYLLTPKHERAISKALDFDRAAERGRER